jgi:hypothetical protein
VIVNEGVGHEFLSIVTAGAMSTLSNS